MIWKIGLSFLISSFVVLLILLATYKTETNVWCGESYHDKCSYFAIYGPFLVFYFIIFFIEVYLISHGFEIRRSSYGNIQYKKGIFSWQKRRATKR